jgi:hypothetical protein
MSKYYCRSCAIALGLIDRSLLPAVNATGSSYQLDKFLKHTQTGYFMGGATSLFSDPTYANYQGYLLSASLSGCLEVDDKNRKNLILWAGKLIGVFYDPSSGQVVYPESGVKVVLHNDTGCFHGFTCNHPTGTLCYVCGCPLP